jgi:pyruvate ferredoxin oxidoreductase delta subunit
MSEEKEYSMGPIILEPGSSIKYKTGEWRTFRPLHDKAKCNKCGICWIFCPEGAIELLENGSFKINLDYCKGCGICANECPLKAIKMIEETK